MKKKKRFDLKKITNEETIWSNDKNFVVIKKANKWTARIRCMRKMAQYVDENPMSAKYFIQVTKAKGYKRWVCRGFQLQKADWKMKLKKPCGYYDKGTNLWQQICKPSDALIALQCKAGKYIS